MRFPAAFLEEIKDRLPISEVVGQRVTWDKRKTSVSRGDYWACCPFHGEKSPSFHCENRKGRYHCFGCGVTGDHFKFVTELDGVQFHEAVERLAGLAGLPLPVVDRRQAERDENRATLHDVLEAATVYFEMALQSPAGAPARAYLRERGLTPATQRHFRLGFAPESRNGLKEHLAQKDYSREQIEATGMVFAGPDIPVSYDRFRDRIMFPIGDARGRVIAFGGRAMRKDVTAKYLNSPETELFHKSNILYNLAGARAVMRGVDGAKTVIAVEGYMDVIAMHDGGYANCVAPLGTALTEQQLEMLWKMTDEPVLCFDGDQAGLKAAWRAVDLALPMLGAGRTLRFALLPEGRDPDDLLREGGPQALKAVIDSTIALSEMAWRRETADGVFDTPERRASLEQRLREVASTIRDEAVRRHYGQDFSSRVGAFFAPASNSGPRTGNRGGERDYPRRGDRQGQNSARSRVVASPALLDNLSAGKRQLRLPLREAVLVGSVVHHPAILELHLDDFATLALSSKPAQALKSAVLDAYALLGETKLTPEEMAQSIAGGPHAETLVEIDRQLRGSRIWQALPDAGFEDALDGWRQAHALQTRAHELDRELRAAELAFASEESEANFERLAQIRTELLRVENIEALIDGFGLASGRPARGY